MRVSLFSNAARRLAKAFYLQFLFFTGLLWWARRQSAKRGVVVITLHRILPDEQYDPLRLEPGMAVRASTFHHFLQYLSRSCKLVLPREILDAGQKSDHRPRVILTFDDGWKDNFETAFPVTQKYAVPFIVFICPQMIERGSYFWTTTVNRLWWTAQQAGKVDLIRSMSGISVNGSVAALIEGLKHVDPRQRETFITQLQAALAPCCEQAANQQNELLTWADVKEMANAGIDFGSHTSTHPILTDISREEATRELAESKSAIESRLNNCPWFAYPNGDWSPSVRQLVQQAGYQIAFANSPGIWEMNTDKFSIPRVNLWEGSFAGWSGRFSRIALDYAVFWKAYRAHPRTL